MNALNTKQIIYILPLCMLLTVCTFSSYISTDSRIRNLEYNKNEVFRIVVHYGYQSSIEFQENETIEHIFAGNNYAWALSTLENRLFIRPLEENIMTNMTIITNERTYQVELISQSISNSMKEELTYVTRFILPHKGKNITTKDTEHENIFIPEQNTEIIPNTLPKINFEIFNFNYHLPATESKTKAKIQEIFDDGKQTFISFIEAEDEKVIYACSGGICSLQKNLIDNGEYKVLRGTFPILKCRVNDTMYTIYNKGYKR